MAGLHKLGILSFSSYYPQSLCRRLPGRKALPTKPWDCYLRPRGIAGAAVLQPSHELKVSQKPCKLEIKWYFREICLVELTHYLLTD